MHVQSKPTVSSEWVPPNVMPLTTVCASTPNLTEPERQDPDLVLVNAIRAGDESAFEALVRRHEQRLLRVAFNVTRCDEDAEEAVQEAFLKAYRNLDKFQENARFLTWLIRITLNESILKLRSRRLPTVSIDGDLHAGGEELPSDISDWGENPEESYRASELREILARCLNSLSPPYRMVFQLRDVEDLSIVQTAKVLSISIPAVKTRLLRARLQLRERLNKYFGVKRSCPSGKRDHRERPTFRHPHKEVQSGHCSCPRFVR